MDAGRTIQAIIGLVSNKRAGVDISNDEFRVFGIFKYQGGVVVNNRDIVIKKNHGKIDCYDDSSKSRSGIAEIVNKVTEEIVAIDTFEELYQYAIDNSELSKERVNEIIANFASSFDKGDPLRNLFLH